MDSTQVGCPSADSVSRGVDPTRVAVGSGFEAVEPSQWAPSVPAPLANSTRRIMIGIEPVVDPVRQSVISDVSNGGSSFTIVDVSCTFPCGPAGATCSDATKISVRPDVSHSFILLARQGMFELYLDGLLVQYHVYEQCAFTASGTRYNISYPYPKGTCLGGSCRECGGELE